jgi:hypothetical protein
MKPSISILLLLLPAPAAQAQARPGQEVHFSSRRESLISAVP